VFAEKYWPSSSHGNIRLIADTMVDAATLVVASAIEADERHG
jgi:hypothetical protein